MGKIYYKAAIRRVTPGAPWFHLPPLQRKAEFSEEIDLVTVPIPYGSPQVIRYLRTGWNIAMGGDYWYPDEEAGKLFQQNFREVAFDSSGQGFPLDVCLSIHSGGTLTEILRNCCLTEGIRFTDGKTDRWRSWPLNLRSFDAGLYTSGSNSSGAPPGGAYEIWSGRGDTISNTNESTIGSLSGDALAFQVSDTAAFTIGDVILIGEELMEVTGINAGTDTLTVTRGVGESTPHTHLPGQPIYTLTDPPATGGTGKMHPPTPLITWDDQIQVATDDLDYLMEKSVPMKGANWKLVYANLSAGDDGAGSPGTVTTIAIAAGRRNTSPTILGTLTINKGSTAGAIATLNIQWSDGDTLWAWPTTSGGHTNVRIHPIFQG